MSGRFGEALRKISLKYRQFMYGRYGSDRLNMFLSGAALFLCIVSIFIHSFWLNIVVLALLVACFFRTLSRKYDNRRRENQAFLRVSQPVFRQIGFFVARVKFGKTHRVYMCESCKNILRVPNVKGKIEIKCPKCGRSFVR